MPDVQESLELLFWSQAKELYGNRYRKSISYHTGLSAVPRLGRNEALMVRMKHQELLKGLIRLHVLHHASQEPFYGQWMIHELARHGYTLSPGTLYPMLHGLERRGYLKSKNERNGRTFRRMYWATALGREANKLAKIQVRELVGELQRPRRHSS
jgi:PadR family transcriptional regulator, regulatory protein PadR